MTILIITRVIISLKTCQSKSHITGYDIKLNFVTFDHNLNEIKLGLQGKCHTGTKPLPLAIRATIPST